MPPLGKLPLLKPLTMKFFYGLKKVGVEFLGIESKFENSLVCQFGWVGRMDWDWRNEGSRGTPA